MVTISRIIAMDTTRMPESRRWHDINPVNLSATVAILAVVLVLHAILSYRAALERFPEIGRAVPIEELRAAWAEADETEPPPANRPPFTMPQHRQENRQ
jgi:hypothetical protein